MKKITFFTRTNRPKASFVPSSTGFSPVYEERLTKSGVLSLIKTGVHNVNDYVQASKDSTLIYNILERFALGDTSVLEKTKGFFADVVNIPKSLVEVHNFMSRISDHFDQLPSDIKEKFGNSAETFIASIENGEFAKIFDVLNGKSFVEGAQESASPGFEKISDIAQKKDGD